MPDVYRCAKCSKVQGVDNPPPDPCDECGSEEYRVESE